MSTTAVDPTDRLNEKLAAVIAAATEAGDTQTVNDLVRRPALVVELDEDDAALRAKYAKLDTILARLEEMGVSQSVVGHAAGRSKTFVGYRLGRLKRPTPPVKRKHR